MKIVLLPLSVKWEDSTTPNLVTLSGPRFCSEVKFNPLLLAFVTFAILDAENRTYPEEINQLLIIFPQLQAHNGPCEMPPLSRIKLISYQTPTYLTIGWELRKLKL